MNNDPLTVYDLIRLFRTRIQSQRESGESDLRSLLYFIDGIWQDLKEGHSGSDIMDSRLNDSDNL